MFCSNCGKEVPDNAYVCTGCGCLIGSKKTPISGDKGTSLRVLILLSVLSVALTFLLFTLSFATYSGGELLFDMPVLIASYLLAWLFVFPIGIVTFVFGVKEKQNAALKLIANATFIVCVAVFIMSVAVFICQR